MFQQVQQCRLLQLWEHETNKTQQNPKKGEICLLSDPSPSHSDAASHAVHQGLGEYGTLVVQNNIPTGFTDAWRRAGTKPRDPPQQKSMTGKINVHGKVRCCRVKYTSRIL